MTAIDTIATQASTIRHETTTIPSAIVGTLVAGALVAASILMIIVGLATTTTAMMLTGTLVFSAATLLSVYTGINALAQN
ncbi:Hypothetical protein PROPJV5_0015 [Propionibacterium ruminifibrarum]|uniref:Uncharacterized protein n=2 Tax=Propionibacterium ruminifibrarum TaxID=1962131 RepID=A0A375HXL9_9ACTN|nr:Hypothetical protein PROPJV5_0015 [Propionibacterium ruminifibrarum]